MRIDERKVTREFLQEFNFENMMSVTLSLKQNIYGERLDKIKAQRNFRHFMNLLNKKVFGNSFRRHGQRIKVIPVLEISRDNRLHYHLAICNPYPDQAIWFETQIEQLWKKTRWGYFQNKIDHGADAGWIDYITKLGSHDEVDWENMCRVSRI